MPGDRCPSRTAAGRSRWTASPGKPGGLLGNRVSFTDPETNQSLDATAFYVATMLGFSHVGQESETPVSFRERGRGSHSASCSFRLKPGLQCRGLLGCTPSGKGDKWDAMPLLLVDSLELRKLLGMAADQKYIAAAGPAASQNRSSPESHETDDLHALVARSRVQAG